MAIKVFVSHSSDDTQLAKWVADHIELNHLDTYLDAVDDALMKDGPSLANHLLTQMGQCQQLVAVVSTATKQSWWVPWEIGVGSEKGFRMASYSRQNVMLPSYLEKWPTLHSSADIELYCRLSRSTDAAIKSRSRVALSEQAPLYIRKSEATDFHTRLKAQLRQ